MTDKQEPVALLPCPFCGGDAEMDSQQAFRALRTGRVGTRFTIYCTSCNADMGYCHDDIESANHDAADQEIIAAWNRRTRPTSGEAEPVAWMYRSSRSVQCFAFRAEDTSIFKRQRGWTETPLYTHPAPADVAELCEAATHVGASLVAAISILERAAKEKKRPNMVVASDNMFRQMLKDYAAANTRLRAALDKVTRHG